MRPDEEAEEVEEVEEPDEDREEELGSDDYRWWYGSPREDGQDPEERRRQREQRARRRRAEVAINNPGLIGARRTTLGKDIAALRTEAEEHVAAIDERVGRLLAERRALVERIESCTRAIVGTRRIVDPATGRTYQLGWPRGDQWPDPLPGSAPGSVPGPVLGAAQKGSGAGPLLAGRDLRDLLVELLEAFAPGTESSVGGEPDALHAGAPRPGLSAKDLARLVLLSGVRIEGYPPKTVANALRPALQRGEIRRIGRARYVAGQRPDGPW